MRKRILIIFGIIVGIFLLTVIIWLLVQKEPVGPSANVTPTPPMTATPIVKDPRVLSVDPPHMAANIPVTQVITVTFDRPLLDNELTVVMLPNTERTVKGTGSIMTITPKTAWDAGMNYRYSLAHPEFNDQLYGYNFTTAGPTPEFLPDTQPSGFLEQEEEYHRQNLPDVYVANKVPYATSDFSITSDYRKEPTGHFYFIVEPGLGKTSEETKLRVREWLRSIRLTDEQINNLDIVYLDPPRF